MEIFVINLDRRPDRWQTISDHLGRLGLEFSRVAAIDGLLLEHNDRSLVPRAVDACWRSHQKVYALVSQRPGNTNCLILEDDAVLNRHVNWTKFLNELDEYMTRESIDVLQLGLCEPIDITRFEILVRAAVTRALGIVFRRSGAVPDNSWNCLAHAPDNLVLVPDSFGNGTHCYVISSRAARAFLPLNTPTFLAPDDFFICIARDQDIYRRFKIARVKENLATQRSRIRGGIIDSDLEIVNRGHFGTR